MKRRLLTALGIALLSTMFLPFIAMTADYVGYDVPSWVAAAFLVQIAICLAVVYVTERVR